MVVATVVVVVATAANVTNVAIVAVVVATGFLVVWTATLFATAMAVTVTAVQTIAALVMAATAEAVAAAAAVAAATVTAATVKTVATTMMRTVEDSGSVGGVTTVASVADNLAETRGREVTRETGIATQSTELRITWYAQTYPNR